MLQLSDEEWLRYNRQIVLRQFDIEGQEALKNAAVLIIGAGGLGCAAAQYLAVAGVGRITLVDHDRVELSNLQRQVLHQDSDIGRLKVDSAADSLHAANPYIKVVTHACDADEALLSQLIPQHQLVLDGTDNLETRQRVNRLCFAAKVPLVSAAVIRMEGQLSIFTYGDDEPCYGCLSRLMGTGTLSCVEAGVLAPMVGVMGSLQALEAIKLLANMGRSPKGKLLLVDGLNLGTRELTLPKTPDCPICGGNSSP
ncbi:molybdopterin-synthase adenylyltransferase MoeB [Oceanisphaera arctica]|uniref:Molybdopterin-synthase adenylyltransferase n=1 Tax=Oceanisphaera arctica TaxID=641510 RepID=A0A2P5TQX1_9GAMM|nr:molybdopterin-synthase adenylyltransferase MoeB [Oceanisphaera arctica]PPL18190.1 molybdopterin-synthase adenylyltransferase MoeB [Oceanisphaera arctica]GHA12899.1 molybdopterin-synthase adenylyltransferase MoeB [Oceanisphaera arctica]